MPEGERFSAEQIGAIRAALRDLLAWDPLRRSPRLSDFLSYIVDARLRGDEASVKAYAIAVDVFGRDEDFDPQADPIVRVQARRLRSLLSAYYAGKNAPHGVRIALPRGRYVPEFLFESVMPAAGEGTAAARGDRRARGHRPLVETVALVGGLAATFVVLSFFFWPNIARRNITVPADGQPQAPLVVVEEFENLTNDIVGTPLVAGLAVELVTDFNQFPHLGARYGGAQAELGADETAGARPVFVLSGVVSRTDDGVQYGALLSRTDAGTPPVSLAVNAPVTEGQPTLSLDEVSRLLAMRIAGPRGALLAPARAWLDAEGGGDIVLAPYPCMVAFARYQEAFDADLAARVTTCASAQLSPETGAGEANAMLASLAADGADDMGLDLPEAQALLARAAALSEAAVAAAPTDAFVWAQHAHVATVKGDYLAARDRYNTAVQLNPADVATLAHFAAVLAQTGNWALALEHWEDAMAAQPDAPPRFHVVPALWAFRNGDYAAALPHARAMSLAYPALGAAVLVALGGQTGDAELANAYLPRLLADQRYRRLGIMPALRQTTTDPALLRTLSSGISRAGVPLDRLAAPF